jgi:hypothetical protein
LRRVLRETHERNGWLIFYTHDVADEPSWIGCSPRLLRATIEAVQVRCLTVRDALSVIGYSPAGAKTPATEAGEVQAGRRSELSRVSPLDAEAASDS